ncbi:CoaE-domain-containing protein [Pseudovirgaria hyperparasitica]|uniref:CoaE-domain-containing protein n=1 Tax=Pseudovirgaria hyperparasitica TaxID=470096 RepID=A0A6A6VTX6_9PEZI|nr:CoaE-domain-containing protein [Pseudovirgaria hyperparasitica]KAF2754032.1 CoaE-domain-containing protein [Pseudovirgaria hyperparasitica]
MLLLGLTGSIATGKSTVSSLLSSAPYNLPIIDADLLARKVVEPGTPGYASILKHFGPSTPDLLEAPNNSNGGENGPSGKGRPLNRPALGKRVFGTSEEAQRLRKVLGGIVHPAVRREMYKELLSAYLRGCWAVVLDVPLLFESGWERYCGCILVVAVRDPAIQMKRLRDRDPHLSAEDAENRVVSQGDVREKAERVMRRGKGWGEVVWNDGDREELKREVERVMRDVRVRSPAWWGWVLLLCPPVTVAVGLYSFLRSWRIQKQWEGEKRSEKAKL